MADAVVVFSKLHSDDRPTAVTATTDQTGRFEPVMIKGKGLPTGQYIVSVMPKLVDNGGAEGPRMEKRSDIPARYQTEARSPLRIEVKDGSHNHFDLVLE